MHKLLMLLLKAAYYGTTCRRVVRNFADEVHYPSARDAYPERLERITR